MPVNPTLALDPMMVRGRPIEEALRAASDAGYRAVEWSPREDFFPTGRQPRVTKDALSRLRRAAVASDVTVASVAAFYDWSSPDPDVRSAAVDWYRVVLETASDLGCPRLNTELKGDPMRAGESEAAFRRSLDELLPVAEGLGIHIAVEPHPYDFVEENDQAVDLIRSFGSPSLGYLFCAPHTYIMGELPSLMIAYAGAALTHVHVADSFRPSQYITNPGGTGVRVHQHLDLGLGEVPWLDTFSALRSIDYRGLLTVAVFAHPERAEDSFRRNRERTLEFLQTAEAPQPSSTSKHQSPPTGRR